MQEIEQERTSRQGGVHKNKMTAFKLGRQYSVNWKQLLEVEEADLRLQELPGYWKWKLYTVLSHSSSSIKDSWIQEPMRG